MAAGDGNMEQGRTLPSAVDWSKLPDDLLGMIRRRIVSPRERVRFTAVCRSWCAAATQQPAPPAIPLLLLSVQGRGTAKEKYLYCPEEAGVLQVPIRSYLRNMRFCGSYDGGWLAAVTIPSTFAIINLFSGVEVPLSREQRSIPWAERPSFIRKTIFSDVPTSSGCILATMTYHGNIALCRVGSRDGGWVAIERCDKPCLDDIIFFRGELYGLAHYSDKLVKFDISVNKVEAAPVVTASHLLDVQWQGPRIDSRFSTYIFELAGKLAMAVMTHSLEKYNPLFKVFQLDVATKDEHKWEEVPTLGDSALFLGRTCSSWVVNLQAGGHGGVKKNQIYYFHHWYAVFQDVPKFNKDEYLMRSEHGDFMRSWEDKKSDDNDDNMERIPSVGYYIMNGLDFPLWCFPPDF